MSNYMFAPAVSCGRNPSFAFCESSFTEEELNRIKTIVSDSDLIQATCENLNLEERNSKVSWINCTQETSWLYERMAKVARTINAQFYNFDLYGFVEDMQFTTYNAEEKSHYSWHIDMTETSPSPRKLAMILQLSDPSDYEGGEVEIWTGGKPETLSKEKGFIALFPSYMLHRVTPVTRGVRRSLVVWIAGPPFK